MTRKRVYVAILNQGSITAGLETSIIGWSVPYRDRYEFQMFYPTARPIPNNRNQIVREFLKGTWDILFMFDDDNVPTSNPFSMLDHDLDVCGGCYPGRGQSGFHFHVYYLDEDKYPEKIFFKHVPENMRVGVAKVDAVATGCICIKRHVLEKMKAKGMAPFEDLFDKDGVLITNDDMAFCLKCKKLGIPVHADWNVICDHFKEVSLLEVIRLISEAAKTGKAVINEDFSEHK